MFFLLFDLGLYITRTVNIKEVMEGPETKNARQMFEFIRTKTKKDDVVVFFKPRVMNLYTGRRSCIVNDSTDHLMEIGDYVVFYKKMGQYNQLFPIINQNSDSMIKRIENMDFVIFQILFDLQHLLFSVENLIEGRLRLQKRKLLSY